MNIKHATLLTTILVCIFTFSNLANQLQDDITVVAEGYGMSQKDAGC
jgi:hypothetical protein